MSDRITTGERDSSAALKAVTVMRNASSTPFGIEGERRVVAGAPPLDLHDVALAGHRRHPGRGTDAHHIREHARHADLLRVADRLLHQAEPRPGGGGEGLRAGQRRPDDRVRAGDLVLGLQEAEFGMLGGVRGRDVEDLGRGADRVTGVVARARGQRAAEDGLVALGQLASHGTPMIAIDSAPHELRDELPAHVPFAAWATTASGIISIARSGQ